VALLPGFQHAAGFADPNLLAGTGGAMVQRVFEARFAGVRGISAKRLTQ